MADPRPPRWLKPVNKLMIAAQKLGLPTGPPMVLTVPGRKTGKLRSTPITPFTLAGQLYTLAGFPGSDWASNARAAGTGTLSQGRKSRQVEITELTPRASSPGVARRAGRSAGGGRLPEARRTGAQGHRRGGRGPRRPVRSLPVRPAAELTTAVQVGVLRIALSEQRK
jgi:hypothetical protein